MNLPLRPPLQPQLARPAKELPVGEQWCYEPKYDGFRAIAFIDGDEMTLQSRGGKPLDRYFPELSFPAGRYVLDGEVVKVRRDGHTATVTASVAETVSVLADPSPPPRIALPEQLVLGHDRYGR